MRAPKPSVMFDLLCSLLGAEESKFQQNSRRVKGVYSSSPCMTRGLSLEIQHLTGDREPLRIQVMTHTGEGTGGSSFLYSVGAADFARQVWAIQAGLRMAQVIGVNTGDLKP